jgi:hypothetical protein
MRYWAPGEHAAMTIIDPPPCETPVEIRAWIAELESWLAADEVPGEELIFDEGYQLLADGMPLPTPPSGPDPAIVDAIEQARGWLADAERVAGSR